MAYGSDDKKLSKKEESKVLTMLDEYFQQALADPSWREAREEMVQCFDYKENRQWTKQELEDLRARGQPATVNNQVKVTIDRIVGQFTQLKTRTVFKPRNGDIDTPVAQAMTDIYSYIRQSSGLDFEERDVVEDGATGGFGVFETCIEGSDDDPLGQEVIVRAEDCFNIFPDPRSRRYDWNIDARYICRAKWVDQDYAKEMYPKKKGQIGSLFTDSGTSQLADIDALRGEAYVDYKRDRVRLIEVQYKESEQVKKYVFSDGKIMEDDDVDAKLLAMADQAGITYETKEDREDYICIGVFCSGILFEHGRSKRKRYSFDPYFVNRKKSGAPYSMITTAIPIQDAINKRESKALALLTLNQTKAEKGAVADIPEWQSQNAKPDGFLEIEEGFFDKVQIDKNLELAQSQNQMHQQSKQDFRLVTGVNPDALGEKSEVRSGVGIQRKVAMTGLVIAPIFDNFRRTRECLAKTIHDAVCIAYTAQKILTITDNPKESRAITLSNETLEGVKQTKYDIIISEDQDFDTVQEQQQEIISRALPQLLQFGPEWAEFLIEMSSIREKGAMLAKIKEMRQAAPKKDHNISYTAQLDRLSIVEKVFLYQEMGMPPQMIQAMMQQSPPPTQILDQQAQQMDAQGKAQAEQAKLQAEGIRQQGQIATEQHKHGLEQAKMGTVQMKAQAEQQKSAMDIEMSKMDLVKKQMEISAAAMQPQGAQNGQ